MPFNHKNKTSEKNNSLPNALGFSEKRADEILTICHKIVHNHNGHHKALLELNGRFNDNELLFAAYAYGRMAEGHSSHGMPEGLEEAIEEFAEGFASLLSKRGK
jgi:hypothetical protein